MNKRCLQLLSLIFFMLSHEIYTQKSVRSLEILNQSIQASVEFIHIYFTPLSGKLHDVIIPRSQFKSALEHGLKFDGSSIPGCTNIFDSDMHLALDPSTFFVQPKVKNQPKTARIFAYIFQNETTPYQADPRYLLAQAMQHAANLGYKLYAGPEIEFFLLEKNSSDKITPWDNGYYFGAEIEPKHEIIEFEIMQTLLDHGINIEKLHHEVAVGQHEFSIHYDNPMRIADEIMLAKHLVKQVANSYGLIATFMPKPFLGMNGSGMHIHLSLADIQTNENIFFNEHDDAFLSSTAHHFIAGILDSITDGDILLNSTINSFKRLVPGYEAPVYICWAKKNRSALIRIPQINIDEPYAARAEIRCADALCNPYLALTFLLQAGLKGITDHAKTYAPIEQNLFKLHQDEIKDLNIRSLPHNLEQALQHFMHSTIIPSLLPEICIHEFTKLKLKEAKEYQKAVTNWEIEKYM